ncbi:MAG: aspartate aminotransferase family protein [Flavobacteriales bacterium]|nr:aspartate aminotransferase family protein [Flavobacteriales bacterium]MCX7767904.1 aspartate aminotransferase family protein [Flavobacteriales bacterium]MDW8409308.1 aspartate aminotransferase family protein [Flavobacteriales bacterium]
MHRLEKLFLEHLAPTSPEPLGLTVSRARGAYIFDLKNKRYIDLIAGISVGVAGHSHPRILRALRKQMKRHLHVMVYGEFVQRPQVKLAERLLRYTEAPIDCVYFVNSGAEATELAMKLAKKATGRPHFVAFRGGYHGSTQGALSLMAEEKWRFPFSPLLPGIAYLPFNEIEALKTIDQSTAAVFVEVIQAETGASPARPEFLKALRDRCDATGALLVVDEIQTGLGRTGKFWSHSWYGLRPDIILSAKALGGGLPLGAVLASRHLFKILANHPPLGHITTFGGNPLSCAAALGMLEVLEKENLCAQAIEKEKIIRETLVHPQVAEVRGRGLLLALVLRQKGAAPRLARQCLEAGVMTDWFLFSEDALRIAPPLNIPEKVLQKALNILLKVIEKEAK